MWWGTSSISVLSETHRHRQFFANVRLVFLSPQYERIMDYVGLAFSYIFQSLQFSSFRCFFSITDLLTIFSTVTTYFFERQSNGHLLSSCWFTRSRLAFSDVILGFKFNCDADTRALVHKWRGPILYSRLGDVLGLSSFLTQAGLRAQDSCVRL